MTKTVIIPLVAAFILAVSTCGVKAQNCSPCAPACYPSYQQFCVQNYSNSCVGQSVFTDKTVRPFNYCMSTCGAGFGHGCGGSCAGGCCLGGHFGGCLDRLLGRNVQCAGPDMGYTYTPGYGANGQGLAPGYGYGASAPRSGYTYRSPRDYLNPNPPSIGY